MALSNAERQRAWRERQKGKPRGNVRLMAELATLRAEIAALKQERDDLAESLAQVEAYQPGITDAAKVWAAQIDRASRGVDDDSEWPERN
jgi:predicted  nucleic acid-binding Zn-ribbon protein